MKNSNKQQEKLFIIILSIIIVVSLIPILALSIYNHPSADDFGYSTEVYHTICNGGNVIDILQRAFLTSIDYMYNWQGLYSSAFLLALQPAAFGEKWYALTTFILLAFIYGGLYGIIQSLIKNILKVQSKLSILLAFVMLCYIVQVMPSPVQGLYWYNGAVNYLAFWGLMLVEVAAMLRFWSYNTGKLVMVLTSLLSYIISGGNHITAVVTILINLCFIVLSIIYKRNKLIILPFVFGCIGFAINITAPGTANRWSVEKIDNSLFKTIMRVGHETIILNSKCFTFSYLLLLIVLTPFLLKLLVKSQNKQIFNTKGMISCLVFDFMIILVMYGIPYCILGTFGEGRVTNTIYSSYYVLGAITYSYLLGCLVKSEFYQKLVEIIKEKNEDLRLLNYWPAFIVGAMVYISIAGVSQAGLSNGIEAFREIKSGEASQYSLEYDKRVAEYLSSENENVVVEEFSVKPMLLYFADVSVDYNHWANTALSSYYGLKSVQLSAADKLVSN